MSETIVSKPSAGMVMIGCKHPGGVVLNLDHYVVTDQQNKSVRRTPGKQASVTLKGWSHNFNVPDPGAGTGGYVLTPVPASFWEAWIATHPDFPMLEDKTIIGPHRDGIGQAKDLAAVPKMFAPDDRETRDMAAAKLRKGDD